MPTGSWSNRFVLLGASERFRLEGWVLDLVESLLSGSSFQGWGLLGDEFGGRMSFRRELGDVAPKSRRSGWLRLPWNGCLPCVCVLGRGGVTL